MVGLIFEVRPLRRLFVVVILKFPCLRVGSSFSWDLFNHWMPSHKTSKFFQGNRKKKKLFHLILLNQVQLEAALVPQRRGIPSPHWTVFYKSAPGSLWLFAFERLSKNKDGRNFNLCHPKWHPITQRSTNRVSPVRLSLPSGRVFDPRPCEFLFPLFSLCRLTFSSQARRKVEQTPLINASLGVI